MFKVPLAVVVKVVAVIAPEAVSVPLVLLKVKVTYVVPITLCPPVALV